MITRLVAALAFIALLASSAASAPLQRAVEWVDRDPPRDEAHPARNQQLLIESGGAGMNALFFLASGERPKPTMLLLHGLPGNERNLDLAQAVRRAGWNVLTFTYRGAWGSEGRFSIEHAIEDASAALVLLKSPEAAEKYGVDVNRIVIAGHSMGGYAAAETAARNPGVAGLVLLDAWDIGASAAQVKAAGEAGRTAFMGAFDDIGNALGPVKAPDLADELIRSGERWRLASLALALARVPVLTVYASEGNDEENRAFATLLRSQTGATVTAVELASDHSFADKRIALAAEIIEWLEGLR